MALSALIIALVALLVSIGSLIWQFQKHRLDGARVRAELKFTGLRKDGSFEFAVATVRNRGRGETHVDYVLLRGPGDEQAIEHPGGWDKGRPVPYRLGPGASVDITFGLGDVYEEMHELRLDGCAITAECGLGSGKIVRSAPRQLSRRGEG